MIHGRVKAMMRFIYYGRAMIDRKVGEGMQWMQRRRITERIEVNEK